MQRDKLLELIWSEAVELPVECETSPLSKILACLLERPVVGLLARNHLEQPVAMFESDDLFPGTSLSDVLEEELEIEVEDGALVIFEPSKFANAKTYSGRELGVMLGRILVDLAGYSYDMDDAIDQQNLIDAMNMTLFKHRRADMSQHASRSADRATSGSSAEAATVHYLI